MQVKSYETKVGSVRTYQFDFNVALDDDGNEVQMPTATDDDFEIEDEEVMLTGPEPWVRRLARELHAKNKHCMSYEDAIEQVMADATVPEIWKAKVGYSEDPQILYQNSDYKPSTIQSPSEHLHHLATEEMDQFPEFSYQRALRRVIDRNPELVRLYSVENNGAIRVTPYRDEKGVFCDISEFIDGKAKKLLARNECRNYQQAVTTILRENHRLAVRYSQWISDAGIRRVG